MSKEVTEIRLAPGLKPERSHENGTAVKKKDKTPTLIQNRWGQYHMVPKYLADEMEKAMTGVILTSAEPDYLACFKMALGYTKGVKAGDSIQIDGKWVKPDKIGSVDAAVLLEAAEKEVENLKPTGKEGIVVTDKMPEVSGGFEKRLRRQKFNR